MASAAEDVDAGLKKIKDFFHQTSSHCVGNCGDGYVQADERTYLEGVLSQDRNQKAAGDNSLLEKPMSNLSLSKTSIDEYPSHLYRGLFVLFNEENFTDKKRRVGSHVDAESLMKTFSTLGFECVRFNDTKKADMIKILKKVASLDHSNMYCVSVCLLTHGDWIAYTRPEGGKGAVTDTISASDEVIKISELTDLFRIKNSHRSLRGKPKLFIIQTCRGNVFDDGVEYKDRSMGPKKDDINIINCKTDISGNQIEQTNTPTPLDSTLDPTQPQDSLKDYSQDSSNTISQDSTNSRNDSHVDPPNDSHFDSPSNSHVDSPDDSHVDSPSESFLKGPWELSLPEHMPVYKDFVLAWSTPPGFFSFRTLKTGSVYIQTLCRYLEEYHSTADLLSILTMVNSDVAHNYQSKTPKIPSRHKKKQMPCFFSRLTKDVYFKPKLHATESQNI